MQAADFFADEELVQTLAKALVGRLFGPGAPNLAIGEQGTGSGYWIKKLFCKLFINTSNSTSPSNTPATMVRAHLCCANVHRCHVMMHS